MDSPSLDLQICVLTNILHGEKGADAQRSQSRKELFDSNALVTLLTLTSPKDLRADRVVASTHYTTPEGQHEYLLARNSREKETESTSVEVAPSTDSVEVILKTWEISEDVDWLTYLGWLVKIFKELRKPDGFTNQEKDSVYLFTLRRCYGKLACRMIFGWKLWRNHPLEIVHKHLTLKNPRFDPFEVSICQDGQKHLKRNRIFPDPASASPLRTSSVNAENVAKWLELFQEEYSTVWGCLIKTIAATDASEAREKFKCKSQSETSGGDILKALHSLKFIYAIVRSGLLKKLFKAVTELSWLLEEAIHLEVRLVNVPVDKQLTQEDRRRVLQHVREEGLFMTEVSSTWLQRRIEEFDTVKQAMARTVAQATATELQAKATAEKAIAAAAQARITALAGSASEIASAAQATATSSQATAAQAAKLASQAIDSGAQATTMAAIAAQAAGTSQSRRLPGNWANQHAEAILMGKISQPEPEFCFGSWHLVVGTAFVVTNSLDALTNPGEQKIRC
ncbi:hypothetical protein EST38_g11974 [Candolleomyces aberdarensis]|uniref:Uncharacterized protein n=1 Tax=Candolleomyces aberdarensis TaxID=2316362 RepID=A0A4Q2D3L2_9AGAR|nr:hypothetical protein EST38_g11974 [Candolleomyces aberdarensis]